MAGGEAKGEAIALDSVFSPEETATAVHRVEEAVSQRRRELERLRRFASDNSSLSSLVQRLPDETSHDVMVPFGGVAFFPGRLIHTNELLVLLGESYYAERSAKQTVEILQRRGKSLEAQMESLKATISDLEAEAKFFSSTATEAAEGLVEIREEYIEDSQDNKSGSSSSRRDEEREREEDLDYKRVMARLDELEKEEQEAGSDVEEDLDEVEPPGSSDEDDEDEVEPGSNDGDDEDEVEQPDISYEEGENNREEIAAAKESGAHRIPSTCSEPKLTASTSNMIFLPKASAAKVVSFNLPEEQSVSTLKSVVPSRDEHYGNPKPKDNLEESQTSHQPMIMGSSNTRGRAFIGSIIEHDHGLAPIHPQKSITDPPQSSNPSRPVSRFKLQKGSR
ncbi:RNA polymerase II subunit 5-mediating protein-like protein [Rhynchospora pubera]|uniref:RNA polymerase II subunit 5-mediating protein-like protein n=1 Tax=Rhynchospora pubera TaxID=906938 RepID=A0AAV8H0L5_9POAL|nr:RNA polymerase II subunit 5-mediating protein-like protein [Rhynchospora pubera]